jgi:hypothetical protein
MSDPIHYSQFYDDDGYIIRAGRSFRDNGRLAPAADFLHAPPLEGRASHRDRLKKQAGSFAKAIEQVALQLFESAHCKARLGYRGRSPIAVSH